jgi:hypothetical protein
MLLAFLAYEKAFDEAVRNKVWQTMTDKNFPQSLIRVAQIVRLDTEFEIYEKASEL